MPMIHCPHCDKRGNVPDSLTSGAKIRCKGCQRSFRPVSAPERLESRSLVGWVFDPVP
jgi:hypothetical protein